MLHISQNTLNGVEILSATFTGYYKDGKREYVIFCRYPGIQGKFVVSRAFENETGWNQGHYFHEAHDENAFSSARALYNKMVDQSFKLSSF